MQSPAQSWPWNPGMQEAAPCSGRPREDELGAGPSENLCHPNQS